MICRLAGCQNATHPNMAGYCSIMHERIGLSDGHQRALSELIEAAEAVIENDQHLDFGIPPPGWHETHAALHEALRKIGSKRDKA